MCVEMRRWVVVFAPARGLRGGCGGGGGSATFVRMRSPGVMAWGGAGGGSAYESRITIHQRRSTIALRGTRGACGGMATSPCPGLTKPRHP